jgi:hypothetical protein
LKKPTRATKDRSADGLRPRVHYQINERTRPSALLRAAP